MKYDIPAALQALRPGAQWVLRGSEMSGLEWLDTEQTVPSEADINAKISDMDSDEPMRLLRVERDARIAKQDWKVVKAYSKGAAVDSDVSTYMQALRDLPTSASPTLNSSYELDLTSVTWPTEPS